MDRVRTILYINGVLIFEVTNNFIEEVATRINKCDWNVSRDDGI